MWAAVSANLDLYPPCTHLVPTFFCLMGTLKSLKKAYISILLFKCTHCTHLFTPASYVRTRSHTRTHIHKQFCEYLGTVGTNPPHPFV